MATGGGDNAVSDDPSSHAPVVAFPDFRLFDNAQDILDHNKCAGERGASRAAHRALRSPTRLPPAPPPCQAHH